MDHLDEQPAADQQEQLGISVELDPSVAEDLRQQEEKRRRKREAKQQQQRRDNRDADEEEDEELLLEDEFDRLKILEEFEQDDWNEVIAAAGQELARNPQTGDSSDDEEADGSETASDDNDEEPSAEKDEISLSPDDPMATSLPVVLVNVHRLVGYHPSSADEVECLKTQIQSALYGQQQQQPSSAATERRSGGGDDEEENKEAGKDGENENSDSISHDATTATRCDDDFDRRLAEMFNNSSAIHSDTVRANEIQGQQQEEQQHAFIAIPYPDLLCQHATSTNDTSNVHTTRQLWKSLLKRHTIPVVDRVFTHLRNCSRSLVWKYSLRCELLELCRAQVAEMQRQKLDEWKCGRRREELDKLYTVRETFVHRLEMEQQRLTVLEKKREEAVQQALREERYRNSGGGGQGGMMAAAAAVGGVEALDFATTSVMSFPTQQEMNSMGVSIGNSLILGLHDDEADDDAYYEDDYVPVSSDEDEAYDDFSHGDDSIESPAAPLVEATSTGLDSVADDDGATTTTIATTVAANDAMADAAALEANGGDDAAEGVDNPDPLLLGDRVARRERRRQAARQRRQQEIATAKEEEHKAKLEAAMREEERMREACTSQEFNVAMAMVQCLKDRLQGVDNLLESLQEDEWADEETTEEGDQAGRIAPIGGKEVTGGKQDEDDRNEMTLLDQILLEILRSIPVPVGVRAIDHAAWLRNEHLEIVADWKKHFGSLPPFLAPSEGQDAAAVAAAPPSPRASRGNPPFVRAGVAPSTSSTATWGPSAASAAPTRSVSDSRPAHEIRQSLGIVDNEAEDWEA